MRFTVSSFLSEYRAVRATIPRLWLRRLVKPSSPTSSCEAYGGIRGRMPLTIAWSMILNRARWNSTGALGESGFRLSIPSTPE